MGGLAQIKAHTATKPAPNNVPCPTDIALDHGDSHGTLIDGDAGKLLVGTGQWKDCQAKCNENPDCVSWTMKYSAPANGEQHNCYLKKEAKSQNAKGDGAWSENWDVISGGSVVECYMTKGAPAINNADSDNYGESAIQRLLKTSGLTVNLLAGIHGQALNASPGLGDMTNRNAMERVEAYQISSRSLIKPSVELQQLKEQTNEGTNSYVLQW